MQEGGEARRVARREDAPATRVGRRRSDRIVAAAPATKRAVDTIFAASRTELPVLIWGPRGSGRTVLARALHSWSPRTGEAWEEFPCVATPPALHRRALFGCSAHAAPRQGADQPGALERLARGTLVVDGIEWLDPDTGARLVRALASRRFRREGDGHDRPLEARVVLVSERDPASSAWGELSSHTAALPPLAERREEILPLASHFLGVAAREAGVRPVGFTRDARAALLEEPWPGNVTELAERVRQAVALAHDGAIGAETLLLARRESEIPSFREAKRAFEARYVASLLRLCRGNVSQAARLAQKDRKDFYDVIRRTGIQPGDFRS